MEEQIAVIDSMLEGFRHSFTHVAGEHEGQITDVDVLREIECLEATRRILIGLRSMTRRDSLGTGECFHGLN